MKTAIFVALCTLAVVQFVQGVPLEMDETLHERVARQMPGGMDPMKMMNDMVNTVKNSGIPGANMMPNPLDLVGQAGAMTQMIPGMG